MNVLRDFLHVFSYPYSLVRRITSVTWFYLWTRGIVNVLPFVQRRPIEDSTPRTSRIKFDTSSAQTTNTEMSSKEDLEAVVVSSDEKESSGTSSSEHLSNANVLDTSNSEIHKQDILVLNTTEPSDSNQSEVNDFKKELEAHSPKEHVDNHNHSPPPLRAKRNSTTLEEESVAELIFEHEVKAPGIENKLDEVLLNHISKKPKLESPKPMARSREPSESEGLKLKHKLSSNKNKRNRHGSGSRDRPEVNHFISIQMTNPTIQSRLEEVQQQMLEKGLHNTSVRKLQKGSFFSETMVSVKKSHITLHVFHIANEEQMEAAKTAMQKVWERHQNEFEPEPVTLRVEGMGHFKHSVLFAKIQGEKELEKLCKISDAIKEDFRQLGIYGDDSKPFRPHLTLAKLSKVKWNKDFKKYNIRSFPRDLWQDYESTFFGTQRVESLQLLKMRSNDETGYYEVVETYPFSIKSVIHDDGHHLKTKTSEGKAELDTNENRN